MQLEVLVQLPKDALDLRALGGGGGKRGPALDSVAVSLTRDQLIRQVIQGGGNMPAYGRNLSPAETNALVAFLKTMHPSGQVPARDGPLAGPQGHEAIVLGRQGGEDLPRMAGLPVHFWTICCRVWPTLVSRRSPS